MDRPTEAHAEDISSTGDLRVFFHNGHFLFSWGDEDEKINNLRSFSYDKITGFCTAVREAWATGVEEEFIELKINFVPTMSDAFWRQLCWWELVGHRTTFNEETGKLEKEEVVSRALLDEPFRELLGMLEKLHDNPESLDLPAINGFTTDTSVFKLARLYWSARHLQLQAPLKWTDDLRGSLLTAIRKLDTRGPEPAFNVVDFWYIWGVFRDFDEGVVDAMITKLNEAVDSDTRPRRLDRFVKQDELEDRMMKQKEKKKGLTWAQNVSVGLGGRRTHAPTPLQLKSSTGASWRGPKTTGGLHATGASNDLLKGEASSNETPKPLATAPITILRKDRSDSVTSERAGGTADGGENKKKKGDAYTPPSGIGPPRTPKGKSEGKQKKTNTWGGNKRGTSRGGGAGGGSWRS